MTTIRLRLLSQRKNVSSDYSVLKARPSKKHWTKYNRYVILGQSDRSVSMTVRFHLFPFRTQKLSSLVPKIVGWRRPVKIGRCRLLFLIWPVGQAVKTAASHAVNVGSIPARVTKYCPLAQPVEHRTVNPSVVSSSLTGAATRKRKSFDLRFLCVVVFVCACECFIPDIGMAEWLIQDIGMTTGKGIVLQYRFCQKKKNGK